MHLCWLARGRTQPLPWSHRYVFESVCQSGSYSFPPSSVILPFLILSAVSLPLPLPHYQVPCFLYLEKHLLITNASVQVSDCVCWGLFWLQARRGCVTADRFSPVTHGPLSRTVSLYVGLTVALLQISKVITCIWVPVTKSIGSFFTSGWDFCW